MNCSVEHIGLAAKNPVTLKDWLLNNLGGELVLSDGKTPLAFFVRLPGGLLVEIYPATDSNPKAPLGNGVQGWRHLALRVDSIEAARDALSRNGVSFEALIKPAGGGGRVLFFTDPEGNLWHLVERPGSPSSAAKL